MDLRRRGAGVISRLLQSVVTSACTWSEVKGCICTFVSNQIRQELLQLTKFDFILE